MGDGSAGISALDDILHQLRVDVIEAHYSQCSPVWREIDYVPAHNKLYYICEGEGWLRIGDKELRPEPGELVLMPANVLQSFSAIEGRRPFLKYWCHFNADLGDAGLFSWLEVPFRLTLDAGLREEVGRRFEALVACAAERGDRREASRKSASARTAGTGRRTGGAQPNGRDGRGCGANHADYALRRDASGGRADAGRSGRIPASAP
ncbi:AraC family ligand binding domain-containing protein [Cohnella ginsengisoli]|uniref:AraC family ligand binding domain-containing protein n=1 Tax=Cohnella ginsengisoli TaxID=425004 RepID=A0A9X4KJK0_9BACL|nr:AraC family ligand binding domain-containing protein [Cohnella ginsengisoli]MDG0790995.1 AraC family ligand binding domain-containing protein [Cohnella ginsengisoli]